MSPVTLLGDLVSPVAGPLLRRGCPVIESIMGDDGVVVWAGPVNTKGAYPVLAYSLGLDGKSECGTRCAASMFALDLSDPAGMDRAARWLAAHHRFVHGPTAPSWARGEGGWMLVCGGSMWMAFIEPDPDLERIGGKAVPGISALTDPALALRAACLAAIGRAA